MRGRLFAVFGGDAHYLRIGGDAVFRPAQRLRPRVRGDVCPHGAGHGADLFRLFDDGRKAALFSPARSGVQKPFRLARDLADAAAGCGRDHGDEADAAGAAGRGKLFLLFKGNVGEHQPRNARLGAGGGKALDAVRKDDVGIGAQHEGRRNFRPQVLQHGKNFIHRDAAAQGAHVGALHFRPFRCGVGKGDAQFDDVRPVFRRGADAGGGRF